MSHPASERCDAIVIGAGIVGAACAWRLAQDGRRVVIVDPFGPGRLATAAGMGHVVAIAENPPTLALSVAGRAEWDALAASLPDAAGYTRPGTLWIAADDEEQGIAEHLASRYAAASVACELLDAGALHRAEPRLAPGLRGGLLVPGDTVVYAPAVAAWLVGEVVRLGGTLLAGPCVSRLEGTGAVLTDGRCVNAPLAVNAAGVAAPLLTPGLPIRKRKGHLVLTAPAPGFCTHEVIELGYLKSVAGAASVSFACNVQPRAGGRLLLGASRQYGSDGPEIEPEIIARMLGQCERYLPGVSRLAHEQLWTGFRPATPDGLPLIGPDPRTPGLFIAAGHEGLGITTGLITGRLIADLAADRPTAVDMTPFTPARFLK